jgi:hypothetical protein
MAESGSTQEPGDVRVTGDDPLSGAAPAERAVVAQPLVYGVGVFQDSQIKGIVFRQPYAHRRGSQACLANGGRKRQSPLDWSFVPSVMLN